MGGKSGEHEISLLSGESVLKNLDRKKYEPIKIIIDKKGAWCSEKTKNTIDTFREVQKASVAIIMLHGPYGEDGTVQGLLELLGVPYTGADVFSSALCMDKLKTKEIMIANGILIPDYVAFSKEEWRCTPKNILLSIITKLSLPVVVKPNNLGSSLGISIPKNEKQLKKSIEAALKHSSEILVEQYIRGKEIHCGILGNNKILALPLDEVRPKAEFYDYKSKYSPGGAEHLTPAPLEAKFTKSIQNIARKIYKIVRCSGMARVDFLVQGEKIYFNEINTIPGFTATSILPKEAKMAGISFPKLVDLLIKFALEKHKANA